MPDDDTVLRVTDLTKRYGDLLAVDHLSLAVQQGEILGFLGPNGAGKTTTLRMMCGLLRPDAGTIEILGKPLVPGVTRGLTAIGVSPQQIVIWETLTCLEQLEFMGTMYGMAPAAARARAGHLLEVFGLADKARRLGRTLSGGMQRRLNIALGLVHEPAILFLDEPQAGLDPQSRVLVRDYVESLRGRTTVVITTHDMEETEKLADRVCIVDHGKLLVLDTVAGLKRQFGEGELFEIELAADPRGALDPLLERLRAEGRPVTLQGPTLLVGGEGGARAFADVLQEVAAVGPKVAGVRTRGTTLEDVFIRLTGRRLRE